MKKKNVVLCELCSEDTLAQAVVNWGLCAHHYGAVTEPKVKKVAAAKVVRRRAAAGKFRCEQHDRAFASAQGLALHKTRTHRQGRKA
jgi:hypothetical protein